MFVCTSTFYDVRSWKITFKEHCDYKFSLLELYADTLTALWTKIVINGLFSLQKKWKRMNLQSLVSTYRKILRKIEVKTINKLNWVFQYSRNSQCNMRQLPSWSCILNFHIQPIYDFTTNSFEIHTKRLIHKNSNHT